MRPATPQAKILNFAALPIALHPVIRGKIRSSTPLIRVNSRPFAVKNHPFLAFFAPLRGQIHRMPVNIGDFVDNSC
jgi:hypothetical protein